MVSIWDRDTGIVVPTGDVRAAITQGEESVTTRSMWPMLSENMGFHFGDNVALPGDGTYTVEVSVGPMSARRTGGFRDAFGQAASTELSVEFSQEKLDEIAVRQLDGVGDRNAAAPMEMEALPTGQLPTREELPGRVLGEGTSGDAVFVATVLEEPPAGMGKSGSYLALSARTPYNRYPLPFMSLSGTLERDGQPVFDGALAETVDPELEYHYGAVVDSVESGDTLTVSVGAPPQASRHEGYETAFLQMEDVKLQQ
jgi:hypothetical protein